jgi:hypothetical protein
MPAVASGLYVGNPCKRGHSGERYANGNCVECAKAAGAATYALRRPPPRTRQEQRALHFGTVADRFNRKWIGEPNSGCWLWLGSVSRKGYGQIRVPLPGGGNQLRIATHVALELHGGLVPAGMCVLHRCDTPACVNPDHLFVGTFKDNTQDMISKGRNSPPPLAKPGQGAKLVCKRGHLRATTPSGRRYCPGCNREKKASKRAAFVATGLRSDGWTRTSQTKLSEADIPIIRSRISAGEERSSIAADYAVTAALIGMIARGKVWRNV